MTIVYHNSASTGAPVMSGTVGSMIAILDAVLVNGFNSKTVTITRVGTTATATAVGHGFATGRVLNHSGADQTEYNGDFTIFNVTTDTYDFTVTGTPATPATGTITAKYASAGWTKEFSGTNKAVYRPPSGNRFYLRVVDDASLSTANFAVVQSYETMTDVDTGTGVSGGLLYWVKSNVADATARAWKVVAGPTGMYFQSSGVASHLDIYCFLDMKSYRAADGYATVIAGNSTAATNTNLFKNMGQYLTSAPTAGMWVTRSHTQISGSLLGMKMALGAISNLASSIGQGGMVYPAPVDGGLWMAAVDVFERPGDANSATIRGSMPGLWNPIHNIPLADGDTFEGSGGLASRKFVAWSMGSNNNRAFLEISDTWDI